MKSISICRRWLLLGLVGVLPALTVTAADQPAAVTAISERLLSASAAKVKSTF